MDPELGETFGFTLVRGLTRLSSYDPANPGPPPCDGALAIVAYRGDPGAALAAVSRLPNVRADHYSGLRADPNSVPAYGQSSSDAAGAVGARAAAGRGLTGVGVTIAVLDTGVTPDAAGREWGARLLAGRNFVPGTGGVVDPGSTADVFSPDPRAGRAYREHGSPVAALAAGQNLGVAPGAAVLPVRVCDPRGHCRLDHVIGGACYALNRARATFGVGRLVLNLSLGGDTRSSILEEVLAQALAGTPGRSRRRPGATRG